MALADPTNCICSSAAAFGVVAVYAGFAQGKSQHYVLRITGFYWRTCVLNAIWLAGWLTHTHTHTHTHTLTHTHTHTHADTHSHTHTHIYTHSHTHAHIHTCRHLTLLCLK